jgi:hypothetical protein
LALISGAHAEEQKTIFTGDEVELKNQAFGSGAPRLSQPSAEPADFEVFAGGLF